MGINMKTFGKQLLRLRTEKKISQQELAKRSSYTQTYISLIETEKAEASTRCKIALLEILEK